MGNNNQCLNVKPGGDKHLNSSLSPRQVELIQTSWNEVKDDLPKLGLAIFVKFFESAPDLKFLFPKIVRVNENNQLEEGIDKDMLQKHAVTVMEGLGAAVEGLGDAEYLNNVLMSIGQTHFHRHVKPQMLKRLWPSLDHGLSTVLGGKYTKETAAAWKKTFAYICDQMKKGLDNPEMDLDDA